MRDVAARVGVSKALVSLVLRHAPGPSEQTRARVLQAADELGYRRNRTASRLALRRTHLLGVTMDLLDTFQAELVGELQAAAIEHGYDLIVSTVSRTQNEQRAVEALLELRTEALLLLGTGMPTATLSALGRHLPVVVIGRRVTSPTIDVVRAADDVGIGLAVDHLVDLGHRTIVHLDGGTGVIAADRRRGYRQAMRRHGLDQQARVITGAFTEQAGIRAAQALLAEGHLPTALVAVNDQSAIGLLGALAHAGVEVPASICVTGYDDSIMSRLTYVNLTTVSQDVKQQARHAVAAAIDRLDSGRTTPANTVLPPTLVVRGTTGPVRGSSTAHPGPVTADVTSR
jgi:DNA-binding LacI/PurR family transcriptional regulator